MYSTDFSYARVTLTEGVIKGKVITQLITDYFVSRWELVKEGRSAFAERLPGSSGLAVGTAALFNVEAVAAVVVAAGGAA
jgi:hypothetical protein